MVVRLFATAAVAAVVPALSACSGSLQSAVKRTEEQAAAVGVEQTLATLEQPAARRRIEQLMTSPELRQMIRQSAAEAANTAAAYGTRSAMREAGTQWSQTLGPAIEASMVATMRSPQFRRALDETAGEVTLSVLESARTEAGAESDVWSRIRGWLGVAAVAALVFAAAVLALLVWAIRSQMKLTRLLAQAEHGPPPGPGRTPSSGGALHPRVTS